MVQVPSSILPPGTQCLHQGGTLDVAILDHENQTSRMAEQCARKNPGSDDFMEKRHYVSPSLYCCRFLNNKEISSSRVRPLLFGGGGAFCYSQSNSNGGFSEVILPISDGALILTRFLSWD